MVTIQSNLWRIRKKFAAIFIAFCLVGVFSAIYADESDYSTLTIAAKADKKSHGGGE